MQSSALLNNRFQLMEPLGSGGMAQVWRARDTLLDRLVAVKFQREGYTRRPDFPERFLREAQALAKLSHPNLVSVFDFGVQDGRYYMVMELVEGVDLKNYLQRLPKPGKRAPEEIQKLTDIALQVSDGLGLAHRAGIIHCDIKPQNIIITDDGRAKITDFGIAQRVDGSSADGPLWGSPAYFSPEQSAGQPLTPASDVYSVGVMLYEMLTGQLPFAGKDAAALARQHQSEPPLAPSRRNPDISPQLEEIILRALAKEPASRFRNGEQMARVLRAYQTEDAASESYEEEMEEGGIDWRAVGLGFLLMIAFGGLIPLWIYVYFLYNPPGK
jgi:serine/threonine-protein kinase